jgi:putative membrane protein
MGRRWLAAAAICLSTAVVMGTAGLAGANPGVKKDETVYVLLAADGSHKETIVSDWLHNENLQIGGVPDRSSLTRITNLKGPETPIYLGGENLVWPTQNSDVFYQGKSTRPRPVDVSVSYELNGEQATPDQVAGKSGQVKISLRLTNRLVNEVIVQGEQRMVYTPLLAAAVVTLPCDRFQHVQTTSGNVITDGRNQVVTFTAILGLKQSLNLKADTPELGLGDALEITSEVTDFALGSMLITVTPELPVIPELTQAASITGMVDGLKQLTAAGLELGRGGQELAGGLATLSENLAMSNEGVDALRAGSAELDAGAAALSQGIKGLDLGIRELGRGAASLAQGAGDYAAGAAEFARGAGTAATAAANVSAGVGLLVDAADSMNAGAAGLAGDASFVAKGTAALANEVSGVANTTVKITAAQRQVDDNLADSVEVVRRLRAAKEGELSAVATLLKTEVSPQQRSALLNIQTLLRNDLQALSALEPELAAAERSSAAAGAGMAAIVSSCGTAAKDASLVWARARGLTDTAAGLALGSARFYTAVSPLKSAAAGLRDGSGKLADGARALTQAACSLQTGAESFQLSVAQVTQGSESLVQGAESLVAATNRLTSGLGQLEDAGHQLVNGAEALSAGAGELETGLTRLNEEGLGALDAEVTTGAGNIEQILLLRDELVRLSREFDTFTGLPDGATGTVRFVMRTDEIKPQPAAQSSPAELAPKATEAGLLHWLKGLFDWK